ncbi:hypothetical protein EDD86DRAFT_246975 [Gorgonomyces haynaldii]|nr:hypothetical protein EDD86DRAFT_246975 [Gorgonomyces haynaldii]
MLLFSLLSAASAVDAPVRYDGHKVLRFQVINRSKLASLEKALQGIPSASLWNHLEVGNVDVRVPPSEIAAFTRQTTGIPHSVMIDDVQQLIDEQNQPADSLVANAAPAIFSNYQDTATYLSFLTSQAGTTKITIGTTSLGTAISGVKFGTGPKNIVIHGGIHAREWISPAVTTYLTNFLLSSDPDAVRLRSNFTFHVIPVLNPDGYAYSRSTDRMWRKNRQPNKGSSCVGTDANRNFPIQWSKCDESYFGTAPLSAPETAAIYNYIQNLGNVISYTDFHSYSQLFMYPVGWSCTATTKDDAAFAAVGKKAVAALKAVNGVTFTAGTSCKATYPASGTSEDAIYSLGVKYPFVIELRDTGNYGFLLPASQIVPSGEEIIKAMVAAYDYILTNN